MSEQVQQRREVSRIIKELKHELFTQFAASKKSIIEKGAKQLEEELGLPKNMIAIELIRGFQKIISETLIRKTLGPDYQKKHTSAEIDTKKVIEDEAAQIREKYNIEEGEVPNETIYKKLQKKIDLLTMQLQQSQVRVVKVNERYAQKIAMLSAREDNEVWLVIDGSDLYTALDHHPTQMELQEMIPIN